MSDFLDQVIPFRNPRSALTVAALLIGGPVWGPVAAVAINAGFQQHDQAKARRRARDLYNASLTDRGVMIRSGLAARQAVVGRAKVSGPIIYATSTGAKQEYLHLVICLAAHEVDAIEKIYFNDIELPAADGSGFINSGFFVKGKSEDHKDTRTSSTGTFTLAAAPATIESITYPDGSPDNGVGAIPPANISFSGANVTISSPPSGSVTYTINYTTKSGEPLVRIKKFLGVAAGQRDTALETESGGEWTSAHLGKSVARLHVRLQYDQDVFGSVGVPNISAVVRGAKVRDSRTGATAWTQNSALITAWWLQQQTLGLRQPAGSVPDAELSPQANICDENVVIAAGGATQKRYTTNGVITMDTSLRDNLELLVAPMAGSAVYAQGRWSIRAGAYEAPDLLLDESDFAPGSIETLPFAPRRELFNAVTGTYVDAASGYIERQFPIVENETYQGWDGGEQITRDVQMPMVDDAIRAQRLAKIALERARQALTFTATFKSTAYNCKPGDIVAVTLATDGWSAKPFVVLERTYYRQNADRIRLVLRETAAGVWDWAYGEATAVDLAPNTNLPAPGSRPAALTGLTADTGPAYVVGMPDGTEIVRAFLQWTPSSDVWVLQGGRIEIQHKRDDAADWTADPPVAGSAGSGFAAPIDRQRATLVRVRPVNVLGLAAEDWTTYLVGGVTGDNTPPGDVLDLAATVSAATVTFSFDPDTAADHATTELRRGSWTSPDETLVVNGTTATWTAALSGTYTWYAKHRDRSGNYSANLAAVSVAISSAGSAGVVNPLPLMYPWKVTSGGASASVSLVVRRNGTRNAGGAWYQGGSSTVGDGYWVRLTQTGGVAPTGSALGTWLQLSSDRAWSLSVTNGDKAFAGTLDISTSSSGTPIVASGPASMEAQSYSGEIP